MNIAEMLGTPVQESPEVIDPSRPGCGIPAPLDQSAPAKAPRSRWWLIVMVGIATLLIGFAAGTYTSPASNPIEPPGSQPALSEAAPATVGSFAEMVTALQLSGHVDPADLATMYAGESTTAETSGIWINRSAAIVVEPLGDEFWLVTVAVDALEMVEGAYEPAGIQYYELTIAAGGEQPMAVSAPMRVPAPAAVAPTGVPTFGGPVPADQAVAVTSFLEAYLTGRGEVARFASPTSRIQQFSVAPYEIAEVGMLGSDSLGRVKAEVAVATSRGGHQSLEYTLEMTFESGVWEVSDLVAAVDLHQ